MPNKKTVMIAGSIVEILGPAISDGVQGFKVRIEENEVVFIDEETLQDSQL